MAIQNASDLVVYKSVVDSIAQVTRITAISDSAISSNGTVEIVDVVDTYGAIETIISPTTTSATASGLIAKLRTTLIAQGYTSTSQTTTGSGGWYIDVTNQDAGNVPTLSIGEGGTAVLDLDYIEIDVLTFGENHPLELIAYSTQASLSISTDLRDITNKDSDGWAEHLGGKKAFDITTDVLFDLDSTYGIQELWDTYRDRSEITLRFSTRNNNYFPDGSNDLTDTQWVSSNISSFVLPSTTSPNGESTTQGLTTDGSGLMYQKYIYHGIPTQLPVNNKWTFSVYFKATSSDDKDSSAQLYFWNYGTITTTATILSGPGTIVGTRITELSETEWTRVQWTTTLEQFSWSPSAYITLNPYQTSSYAGESSIYVWGPMLSKGSTANQYFEKQLYWEGDCQVNSLSLNAGVEDNTTYTANFKGTGTLTKVSN